MSEAELAERLAEALDACEAWAGWWRSNQAAYVGTTLPPLRRTGELLAHRKGLERETYRRRAVRRERPTGNLRLPLG